MQASLARRFREPLQVERPALIAPHAGGQAFPALAMPIAMAMLHLDPGASLALGDEADLHLAGPVGIGLYLPARADFPREDQSCRRLVGEHAAPPALAAVGDEAPDLRFKDRLGNVDPQHVVLARLDVVEPLAEHPEGAFKRYVDR